MSGMAIRDGEGVGESRLLVNAKNRTLDQQSGWSEVICARDGWDI